MPHFSEFPCPFCGSEKVTRRCWGRKAGGLIGSIAGAVGGFTGCLRGAQTGGLALLGVSIGSVAGAVLGCLAGSSIGCEVGAAVGETIDSHVLNDLKCEDCLRTFPLHHRNTPEASVSPCPSPFTSFE